MALRDKGDEAETVPGGVAKSRRELLREAARRPARVLQHASEARRSECPIRGSSVRPAVFISYARENSPAVRSLVDRLRANGVNVVWDQDFLAGRDTDELITDAIEAAACVLVVWSAAAAASRYVRAEATLGLERNKLVPTHVQSFDPRGVPMVFRDLNTIPIDDFERVARSLGPHGIVLA